MELRVLSDTACLVLTAAVADAIDQLEKKARAASELSKSDRFADRTSDYMRQQEGSFYDAVAELKALRRDLLARAFAARGEA